MKWAKARNQTIARELPKVHTGIKGLDEITGGGLPRGRPTLVCGAAGCGKTLFAMEFLLRGALEYDEPGVFMAFEETAEELAQNVASLGFDLEALTARKKVVIDYVRIEPREILETGEYDLDGLFVRLGYAIDTIGAKRVVLDTVETLFIGLPDEKILRAELQRLFRWLKSKGVSAVITAERGNGTLTRHGLEEYVSDCVILLDHRVDGQVSTRRLRIVKYRGTAHGTNEYPFLIDRDGISILPITSLGLEHQVSTERISTGIGQLDEMLEGKGYYRGSSILLSGTAGTGKTIIAAHFANVACERGEHCLYIALEESPNQIIRNMRSVGLDLQRWVKRGLLKFQAARPTTYGLEMHLAIVHKMIDEFAPSVIIIDQVTNLMSVGSDDEVKTMLMRLVDYIKGNRITALFVSLVGTENKLEATEIDISSLMDTWILVRNIESNGERNRGLYVLKSRGMSHSNQIREFRINNRGIELMDTYLGPTGLLTGAARAAQEAKEKAEEQERRQEMGRKRRELERRRQALEAQMALLRAELGAQEEELIKLAEQEEARKEALRHGRSEMARIRSAGSTNNLEQGESDAIPTKNDKDDRRKKANGARRPSR